MILEIMCMNECQIGILFVTKTSWSFGKWTTILQQVLPSGVM